VANSSLRRARLASVLVIPFTTDQLIDKWKYWGGLCWICREAPATCWDHVKPVARGGPHCLANLRPACKPCNSSKNARWPYG
jgi:5-methylcytosine-specific restriction endonuclease McrA